MRHWQSELSEAIACARGEGANNEEILCEVERRLNANIIKDCYFVYGDIILPRGRNKEGEHR